MNLIIGQSVKHSILYKVISCKIFCNKQLFGLILLWLINTVFATVIGCNIIITAR